jgi:hypothetical protein
LKFLRRANAKMQIGILMVQCARRKQLTDNSFYFAWNAPQAISQAGMKSRWNSRSDNKFHFSIARNYLS